MTLREGDADSLERVVENPDDCDISAAVQSDQLSSIGLEQHGGSFVATIDKLGFRQLVEIVTTVLTANGYSTNLENLLACLDRLRLAMRVRFTQKSSMQSPPRAKLFLPCIKFEFPVKDNIGPLLSKFYSEIELYESEIARLQVKEGKTEDRSTRQLKKENEKLEKENENLRAKLAELSRELSLLRQEHKDLSQAFESQKLLPKNVRSAIVIHVNFKSRHIELKSGSTKFQVPLANLHAVPEKGQSCLVSIVDGQVEGVFFHSETSMPLEVRLAQILYVEDDVCKIRDESRRHWLLTAANAAERSLTRQLRRGDRISAILPSRSHCAFRAVFSIE